MSCLLAFGILKQGEEMPRYARKRSSTGIYHVMLKGIDGRDIFLDDEDKGKFIENTLKARENSKFELYAYCLMDNHVHLLIKESEQIGISIKRITVGYVQWHNNKYARTGHLFQNRYLSEPVETESYLLTVVKYIHQNPLKAGLVAQLADYEWSSYLQYLTAYKGRKSYIDPFFIMEYFKLQTDFESYMNEPTNSECLEYKQSAKYSDEILKKMIRQSFGINDLIDIPNDKRNKMIKDIYQSTGVSIRQLARVLGVGKNIIERALK